jgi:kynurenine formamidase
MELSAVNDVRQAGLTSLLADLAAGRTEVVDLTTPLSAATPTLELPEPFANLIDFSLEEVSAYNGPGPYWKHHNIHTGEHSGTHVDAPIHWATGRDGKDVAQIDPARLLGPAVVLDVSAEAAADPDFLVDVPHIRAWESEHGALPKGGWLLVRTGWDTRTPPGSRSDAPSGSAKNPRCPASAWKRWASTLVPPADSSPLSRPITSCWEMTSTASPRFGIWRSCRR